MCYVSHAHVVYSRMIYSRMIFNSELNDFDFIQAAQLLNLVGYKSSLSPSLYFIAMLTYDISFIVSVILHQFRKVTIFGRESVNKILTVLF